MFGKGFTRFAFLGALVIVLGLLTPAAGLAAGPIGSGPDTALAPSGGQVHLAAGQQQWYIFRTDGQDSNGNPSRVRIAFTAMPAGSATFNLWTPDQIRAMPSQDVNNPIRPIGAGTPSIYHQDGNTIDRYPGTLFWSEDAKYGGTFYVQVVSTGAQASDYVLSVTGDSLSFPTQYVQSKPQVLPVTGRSASPSATNSASAQPAPVAAPAGSSVDNALTTFGRMMTLKPGQQQWYALQVAGDSNTGDNPHINVHLSSSANSGVNFYIWTPDRLRAAAVQDPNNPVRPVGAGTVMLSSKDSDGNRTVLSNGDLFWSGSGRVGGTYYVVVQSNEPNPVQYTLDASTSNP